MTRVYAKRALALGATVGVGLLGTVRYMPDTLQTCDPTSQADGELHHCQAHQVAPPQCMRSVAYSAGYRNGTVGNSLSTITNHLSSTQHQPNTDTQDFDLVKVREEIERRRNRLRSRGSHSPEIPTGTTKWLLGELSSDHAGETGAVWIYKGALGMNCRLSHARSSPLVVL
eukprot:1188388-Prorocentrum_minimum.AAC.6